MPRITQKLTVSRRSYRTVYRYGSSRSEPKLSPEEELRGERELENFQRWLNGEVTPEMRRLGLLMKASNKRWELENNERTLAELITVILPAYLLFREKTNNWSSSKSFKDHSNEVDCRCDPSQLKSRSVQLVDIKRASPRFPHTAFSLPLLKFHHQLLKHCELVISLLAPKSGSRQGHLSAMILASDQDTSDTFQHRSRSTKAY
ncbi:hypothetical protein H4Q26_005650 [Puccinia striiformis f. sp. tritici PST-130]|nr:hypothetical protein H4Q26_005650 [Puccinia striiformis f. sp. tritici PST-130]